MVLLLALPFSVFANFFFMLSDSTEAACTFTPVTTKEQAIALIKNGSGLDCSGFTDANGDHVLTCKGSETFIFFFTPDIDRCNKTRASFKRLAGK